MKIHTYLATVVLSFALLSCAPAATKPRCIDTAGSSGLIIANPASVYCTGLGYTLEVRTGEGGGQSGYCIFPDASACEEWQFFRGQCGQRFTLCALSGNRIETRREIHDDMILMYAVCVLKDGTECREDDFARCRCP